VTLESDLIACDRATGLEGSFYDFVKLVWSAIYPSSPFVDNFHYGLLTEHYEACFKGEIRELVVNLPPGGGKSSLTCVVFPAWMWVRDPHFSIIHAAYGQKLVRRDAGQTLQFMQSKWFQQRWGDRFKLPTVPTIDLIKNDKGGFRLGTTPGGEVTGFHANVQLLDDPNKPEELTKVGLQNTVEWLNRTLDTRWRRPPEVNALVCIMQRLHCGDLAQTLLDRGAVHVCLPAEYDPSRKTTTKWGADPRVAVGELLDPIRMPKRLVDEIRRNLGGINAAAQLDQNPVPEGGAVFRREHLKFYKELPATFDHVVCSWDCAFKAEETSDFVCGQVWGRCGVHFYLIAQSYGHFSFPTTLRSILELRSRKVCGNLPSTVLIEDKANGSGVLQMLSEAVPGLVAVDPRGGKHSRAAACSGFFEAGNVFLPDPAIAPWVDATFIPEVLSFPRGKHDDQVDAMTQALLYLQENTSYLRAAMEKVRKKLGYIDLD